MIFVKTFFKFIFSWLSHRYHIDSKPSRCTSCPVGKIKIFFIFTRSYFAWLAENSPLNSFLNTVSHLQHLQVPPKNHINQNETLQSTCTEVFLKTFGMQAQLKICMCMLNSDILKHSLFEKNYHFSFLLRQVFRLMNVSFNLQTPKIGLFLYLYWKHLFKGVKKVKSYIF